MLTVFKNLWTYWVFNIIKKVRPARLYISSDGTKLEKVNESKIISDIREFILSNIDWDCKVYKLFQKNNLVVPDVGNSHWEEINIINNLDINDEPVFFGWPWYEAYFNANYQNTPVDEETRNRLIEEAQFPLFL